jgi:glutathione S-transferase
MKLYYAPTSPYARKVLAVAHEKGLAAKIEKLPAREPGVNLFNMNPLDKIPTLVGDDGEVLIESCLICQYLDEIGPGRKLYPAPGKERRRMLQLEAIGQGVLDAGVLHRMEGRMHKPEMISAEWLERQQKKIKRGLPVMEKALGELGSTITPAHITYGVTLFFFEQHKIAPGWREANPKLAQWYDQFAQQPCMATTAPVTA